MTIGGRSIACDLVLMSGGWVPSVHLFSQSRGRLTWSDAARAFVPSLSAERERSAGACRGVYGLAAALADGANAGLAAAKACGFSAGARSIRGDRRIPRAKRRRIAAGTPAGGGKAFVDFQNDVTSRDLALAAQEGFRREGRRRDGELGEPPRADEVDPERLAHLDVDLRREAGPHRTRRHATRETTACCHGGAARRVNARKNGTAVPTNVGRCAAMRSGDVARSKLSNKTMR